MRRTRAALALGLLIIWCSVTISLQQDDKGEKKTDVAVADKPAEPQQDEQQVQTDGGKASPDGDAPKKPAADAAEGPSVKKEEPKEGDTPKSSESSSDAKPDTQGGDSSDKPSGNKEELKDSDKSTKEDKAEGKEESKDSDKSSKEESTGDSSASDDKGSKASSSKPEEGAEDKAEGKEESKDSDKPSKEESTGDSSASEDKGSKASSSKPEEGAEPKDKSEEKEVSKGDGKNEDVPIKEGKPEPKTVKTVEIAPAAVVENDDDIAPDGNCTDFIPSSTCKGIELGEGRMAECISQLIFAAETSDQDTASVVVPDACEEEVYNFYIKRSKNINANVPLAKGCKGDAEKNCNNTWFFGPSQGHVISCLKEIKDKVSSDCKVQLFKLQRAAAHDYRADPALVESCKADVDKLCKDVKDGGGRVQACLRDNNLKLSWECAEQLFRQELEADDDIRLSVRLYQRCLGDKKRFCPDVEPGHAEAKDCLIEHRNDDGFSAPCREEIDAMIERRVRDFRLDSRLRRNCQSDIVALCGSSESLDSDETDINICLQDYVNEIRDDKCKSLVKQYQGLAAQDIRFDVPLADACFEDRMKLCANVPPGSARVTRCLHNQRDALSQTCRAALFDEEVRFSENIDFQYPMKKACAKEAEMFCAKVPHGNARVIRCLQENKGKKDFGKACLKEVLVYEERASSDYRLNHRLRTSCRADIDSLCKEACRKDSQDQVSHDKVCGGAVLRCLTQKQDDIKSEACKKEVFYFMKMEVRDYKNDVILAAACRADVEQFCRGVEQGHNGGVHACLRKNRSQLSDTCRKEQLVLEQTEAEHIELRPSLIKSCAGERAMFCKDVKPGNGRVFRCLADNLANPDFGPVCRGEVIMKVQRRQANWRLDPPLRRACRGDVSSRCSSEDGQNSENGLVYKCLVASYAELDAGCRKELGRAVHMAFFVWIPGSILTSPCDVDIGEVCLKERPNMLHQPGAVGTCLANALERIAAVESAPRKGLRDQAAEKPPPRLSPECRALADVAEPPDMKAAFEDSLTVALLGSQLSRIETSTGVKMVERDAKGQAQGITLTGWTALAGIAALVVVLLAGAAYAWQSYRGVTGDGSTVVLKTRHGYSRVATAAS